jgi:hypothetical protein
MLEDEAVNLENTAEWRSEKDSQFPDDKRNAEAAEICSRLASELLAVGETPEAERFSAIEDFIFREDGPGEDNNAHLVAERWNEYRGRIGFSLFHLRPKSTWKT